jgi:hypothetical protein
MPAAVLLALLLVLGLLQACAFVVFVVPSVSTVIKFSSALQQATDAADPFRPARASVDPLVINTLQKVLFRDTDVELALAEAVKSR